MPNPLSSFEPTEPRSPDEWLEVANRYVENIGPALKAELDGAIVCEIAFLSVESLLKALVWKSKKWDVRPPRNEKYSYFYSHQVGKMMRQAELESALIQEPNIKASWQFMRAFPRSCRYAINVIPRPVVWEMARIVRHPDVGVYPWLLKQYRATQ